MYCQKCGSQNEDGVKFCMKCGSAMEAASTAPTATAAPAAAAAPATTTAAPVPVKAQAAASVPVSEATRFEMPAFVLAIIAIVLLIFPIPLLAWFSLPCAILGFMFAFYGWIKCREQKGELSIKTICAAFLAAYVLLNALTLNMGGDSDLIGGLSYLLGNVVGSIY